DEVLTIKQRLGIPSDKKVILYAPTWRDDAQRSDGTYGDKNKVDYEYLAQSLAQDYVLLFRAHYYVSERPNFTQHPAFFFDVSHYDDITDLYLISDVLVTDYSSVFFDFAALNRPMIFFMK